VSSEASLPPPPRRPNLTTMDLRQSVITLALPAVGRMLLQTVVGIVALMIVGRLNAASIAAVGIGNRLFFIAMGVLSAITIGSTAAVARTIGADDMEQAKKVTVQSLMLAVLIGLAVAVIGFFSAEPLMHMMMMMQEEVDLVVVRLGTVYLRFLWASMVVGTLLFTGNAILQGAGDMKTPMYVMAVVNVFNIVLAYVLVFGYGPFPKMGVAGAGLAGGLARIIGGVIVTAFLFTKHSPVPIKWSETRPHLHWGTIQGILDIGLPAAGENLVRQASQIIYTMLIAGLGTIAIAANQIAMSVVSLSFMPGFGFSMAATALVGQNLGASQPKRAEQAGWESLKWGIIVCTTMGTIFFLFPELLLGLYTENTEVIRLATMPLRIIAVSQPFLAVVMILAGGLRGAGDTRYVLFLTTIGNWGIRLVFSYVLGFVLGWGLNGIWIAMAMDQIIRGLLTLLRFRSGKWKDIELKLNDSKQPAATGAPSSVNASVQS